MDVIKKKKWKMYVLSMFMYFYDVLKIREMIVINNIINSFIVKFFIYNFLF